MYYRCTNPAFHNDVIIADFFSKCKAKFGEIQFYPPEPEETAFSPCTGSFSDQLLIKLTYSLARKIPAACGKRSTERPHPGKGLRALSLMRSASPGGSDRTGQRWRRKLPAAPRRCCFHSGENTPLLFALILGSPLHKTVENQEQGLRIETAHAGIVCANMGEGAGLLSARPCSGCGILVRSTAWRRKSPGRSARWPRQTWGPRSGT